MSGGGRGEKGDNLQGCESSQHWEKPLGWSGQMGKAMQVRNSGDRASRPSVRVPAAGGKACPGPEGEEA